MAYTKSMRKKYTLVYIGPVQQSEINTAFYAKKLAIMLWQPKTIIEFSTF